MNGFCVECGKEVDHTVHGLCMECFLRDRSLVSLPDHVDLQRCTICGQYYRHGIWKSMTADDAVTSAAKEALTCVEEGKVVRADAALNYLDDRNVAVTLTCTVDIDGYRTDGIAATVVRIKNTVCRICSRRTGNYYESILQIRSSGKELPEDLKDEVLARVERYVDEAMKTDANAFITKMELVPGGVDVYLSLIALGRGAVKDIGDNYCAEVNESAKLVGQTRDGLDMYRVTYLARLPEFHIGDVVTFRKRYYLLTRVSSQGGKMVSLRDFRDMTVRRPEMTEIKVYEKASDIGTADVITRSEGEVQIMDPSNYSMKDVLVPKDAEIGDKIRVVRIEDDLYYVPSRGL